MSHSSAMTPMPRAAFLRSLMKRGGSESGSLHGTARDRALRGSGWVRAMWRWCSARAARLSALCVMAVGLCAHGQEASSNQESVNREHSNMESIADKIGPSTATRPEATVARLEVRRPAAGGYVFPDGRQQFHSYLDAMFGPPAFVRAAIGAGLDQQKPAPPEWDEGAKGYGERYRFRFGMDMIGESALYGGGALMHEDVTYHRCECRGFLPRSEHALAGIVTARKPSGRTVISLPSIGSPYAGSFAAVAAWYPARYEAADAFRIGGMSFAFRAGMNMIREFLMPAR